MYGDALLCGALLHLEQDKFQRINSREETIVDCRTFFLPQDSSRDIEKTGCIQLASKTARIERFFLGFVGGVWVGCAFVRDLSLSELYVQLLGGSSPDLKRGGINLLLSYDTECMCGVATDDLRHEK